MTGLDLSKARFQALSAFTSTGFTTEEAEEVIIDKTRRKIIMALMVVGFVIWASFVSLIINALVSAHELIPSIIQVSALLMLLLLVALLMRNRLFVKKFQKTIARYLARRTTLQRKTIAEILRLAENYGVAEIEITKDSKNCGLNLREANFRQKDILILAIERDKQILPAPKASDILKEGDSLICYGKLKNMQEAV
jgi:hypothetical protein